MIDVDCFSGAAGSTRPPTLYVYSYGAASRYTRYLVAAIDLAALTSVELNAFELLMLADVVDNGAVRVDDVVAVLAKALYRSQQRLFTRPPRCAIARQQLLSSVRAIGAALHQLTDTIGPLAFTEFKGQALRDY